MAFANACRLEMAGRFWLGAGPRGASACRPNMASPGPDRRLPASARLKRRCEFQKVFQGGRKSVRPFLVVHALQRNDPESTRLGLTVSRRVGNAVVRNRVKRLVRETFRHARPELPPGFDLVIVARSPAARASLQQLQENFRQAAAELGLLSLKD